MLAIGATAPDFVAKTTSGETITLSSLAGKLIVLYFFPKAFTPGCLKETKGFRDNYPELKALGAEVIGVSVDKDETQCSFSTANAVTFPMIGDHEGKLTRLYDVRWPMLGLAKRVTYVINIERKIDAVFHHEFQVMKHLDDVKAHLQRSR